MSYSFHEIVSYGNEYYLRVFFSRAEMQSLSQPVKGWQTRTNLATGRAGNGKKDRKSIGCGKNNGREGATKLSSEFPTAPPKNPMAFERDWRRHCATRELKLRFLSLCGPDGIRKVFKTEIDVTLLSQIIATLAETARSFSLSNAGEMVASAEANNALLVYNVLRVLPKTGRFALNVQFLTESDTANIVCCMDWLGRVAEHAPTHDAAPSEEVAIVLFSAKEVAGFNGLYKIKA